MNRPGEYTTPAGPSADDLARSVLDDEPPASKPVELPPTPSDDLTPAERWKKALVEWKLSEEDAAKILDAMIDPGFWGRDYDLFNGRIKVKLRTRDMFHSQRVTSALAMMPNLTEAEKEFVKFRYDLAGSLVEFKGKRFEHPADDATELALDQAFAARLKFVDHLSQPLFEPLYRMVFHFNSIVAVALSNGAASGF